MKTFNGIVVSQKMDKTAIIEVTRKTPHPLYKKLIKRSKRYLVDTEGKEVTIGAAITIAETRPIAKNKHFKILEKNKKEEKI